MAAGSSDPPPASAQPLQPAEPTQPIRPGPADPTQPLRPVPPEGPVAPPSPDGPVAASSSTVPPGGPPTGTAVQEHPKPAEPKKRKSRLGFLKELPALLVIAFILALLIKTFVMQAFFIPSPSMVPTLRVGDRVLVNKVSYHLHSPRRGDIIVFADPHPTQIIHRSAVSSFFHWLTEGFGIQTDPTKDFIKRVIALPGETVEFAHCQVMINGHVLKEPYTTVKDCTSSYPATRVPANSLFVMGDNRPDSSDSRFTLGFIPYDKVIGRAFVIIWPPGHVGWLHGF